MYLVTKPEGNGLIRGFQAVGEVARTEDWVLGRRKEALSVCTCFWGPQLLSVLLFVLWSQGVGLCLHKRYPTRVVGISLPKVWGWVTWSWQYSQVYGFCMPFVIVSSISVTLFPVAPFRVSTQQVTRTPPVVYTEVKDPSLAGDAQSWPGLVLARAGEGLCRSVAWRP